MPRCLTHLLEERARIRRRRALQRRRLLRLLLGRQQRVLLILRLLRHRQRCSLLPRGQRIVQQQGGARGRQWLLLRQGQAKPGGQRGLPGLGSSCCRRRRCCSRRGGSGRGGLLLLCLLLRLLLCQRPGLGRLLLSRRLHRLRKCKAAAVAPRPRLHAMGAGAAEAGCRRGAAGLQKQVAGA